MGVTVRRLRTGDEQVLALIAADAPDFDLAGRTRPERPLAPGRAAAYLAEPNVLHWIAEDGDAVVGELLCHLLLMPSGEGRELLLYSIGVRSSHRRRGVGAALLDEMRRWMRDARVPEVWVLADNKGAEAFYAACGFTRGGEGEQGTLMLLRVPRDSGDA
ncbi:MAG: GCN5-related N-acetyltransferase [Gaiellaceae bacterium]|jgi:GNAT superfamily N-acetyltransferase|nr:GCN5-related N-acetyltransferase [Gaiellaceae bacterium]